MKTTQSERILKFLKRGFSITPMIAFNRFQCLSLSQRIGDLVRAGHSINRDWKKTKSKKRVRKYSLS